MPSFTEQAIKASFLKLLDQRPLSQITVKDIVEDCGVNRNSFYYHFAGIPALILEIIDERCAAIIAQYDSVDSLEDCLKAVVEFAAENRRTVMHVWRSADRGTVEDYLMRICRHTVERYAQTAIGDVSIAPEDREMLIRFFQCECFGQAVLWLNSSMSYDAQQQFSRMGQIMHGMVETIISRCQAQ